MRSPSGKSNGLRSSLLSSGLPARHCRGSILPLVTMAVLVLVAYIGLSVDVMRTALTVRALQFAAWSAASYGLSYAVDAEGGYARWTAQERIRRKVIAAGGSDGDAFNDAPSGPSRADGWGRSAVTFTESDVTFASNPGDETDLILQVKAQRQGSDALRLFFFPALFAFNHLLGAAVPEGIDQASPYRIAEVIGQPASRIGAGAPKTAGEGTREAELVGFAALPLAISNRQFQLAARPEESIRTYQVNLVRSSGGQAAGSGVFNGAFANVSISGEGGRYYGSAQGNTAVDELIRLINYFAPTGSLPYLAPGPVERGGRVALFDPACPVFMQRKQDILAALVRLPVDRHYIVPVVSGDLSFAEPNPIAGFARLKLVQAVNQDGSDFALAFAVAESVPVRNAAFATGPGSVPALTAAPLPAPEEPFLPRTFDPSTGGLSVRPRAVVLAPALSPRILPQVN